MPAQLDEIAMRQRVENVWHKLSAEIRAEYGEEYKEDFLNAWNTTLHKKANGRLEDVVDAYYHAIAARFPRSRYRCGWDAILIYVPLSFLPTAFGNAIFRFLSSSGKEIVPAAIAQTNWNSEKER